MKILKVLRRSVPFEPESLVLSMSAIRQGYLDPELQFDNLT